MHVRYMCQSGHLTSGRFELFVCHRYMVYIFTCLFSVCNTINLSQHEHLKSGPMMEEISLKRVSLIKHH